MEDLNKQQIVLLCLFVAFFTSIVTGITTVSLLDQEPQAVSQTINRVVEKTIERVVEEPATEDKPAVERVVETVIVNQEDLTTSAVQDNTSALVRIYSVDNQNNKTFAGLGFVVDTTGLIVTDAAVGESSNVAGTISGVDYKLKLEKQGERFNLLSIQEVEDGKTFSKVSFANVQNVKLAQSVILLSGRESNIVSSGIVTNITSANQKVEGSDTSQTIITGIETSVESNKIIRGSVILNLQGEVLGMWGGTDIASNVFFTSNSIQTFLKGE